MYMNLTPHTCPLPILLFPLNMQNIILSSIKGVWERDFFHKNNLQILSVQSGSNKKICSIWMIYSIVMCDCLTTVAGTQDNFLYSDYLNWRHINNC